MTDVNHNQLGDHWYTCDVCGQKTWFSDSRMTWDGFLACVSRGCWYPKHAADIPGPVTADPYALTSETIRPNTNNLYKAPTGISSWSHILPPYDQLTWSQLVLEWASFDDGTSWYTNDQSGL